MLYDARIGFIKDVIGSPLFLAWFESIFDLYYVQFTLAHDIVLGEGMDGNAKLLLNLHPSSGMY